MQKEKEPLYTFDIFFLIHLKNLFSKTKIYLFLERGRLVPANFTAPPDRAKSLGEAKIF
jgi:hypothetical protein